MRHPLPDPNVCPSCKAEGKLRELATRPTWQPVRLAYHPHPESSYEPRIPLTVEYEDFEYSEDATVTGFECGDCGDTWESIYVLAYDQRLVQALRDWAEFHETRAERCQLLVDNLRADDKSLVHQHLGAAAAYRHALAIFHGNGEA